MSELFMYYIPFSLFIHCHYGSRDWSVLSQSTFGYIVVQLGIEKLGLVGFESLKISFSHKAYTVTVEWRDISIDPNI